MVSGLRWLILMHIAFWDSHPFWWSVQFASHFRHYKKVFTYLPRIHVHTYKDVMEKLFHMKQWFSGYSRRCKFSTSP